MSSRTYKAALISIGQASTTVIGLVIAGVLARVLDQGEYATYRQVILVFAFAAPFLTLGLPSALYYFLPESNDKARSIVVESIGMLLSLGFVFALLVIFYLAELIANRFNNPELAIFLKLYAPYAIFVAPTIAISACLVVQDRVQQVALFTIGSRLATLVLGLGLFYVFKTLESIITGTLIAMGISGVVATVLMLKSTETKNKNKNGEAASLNGAVEQLKFGVPLGMAQLISQTFRAFDKVLVAANYPAERFAIYVNGATNLPFVPVVLNSVTSVIMPDLRRLVNRKNYHEAMVLWRRVTIKCGLLLFPIMSFCIVFAENIMIILFGERYGDSALVFQLYLLVLPLRIASWDALLMVAGKTKVILARSLIGLIGNVLLSYALLKTVGLIGPAVATLVVLYAIHGLVSIPSICKSYGVSFRAIIPWVKLSQILLAVIFVSFAIFAIRNIWLNNVLINTTVNAILYAVSIGFIYHLTGLYNCKPLLHKIKYKMQNTYARR